MASSQMPPIESSRASGFVRGVPEAGGKARRDRRHAGRAEQVGGRREQGAARRLVESANERPRASRSVVVAPGSKTQLFGDVGRCPGSKLVDGCDARRCRAHGSAVAVQPFAGGGQLRSQDLQHRQVLLEAAAHDLQRLPEALLADLVAAGPSTAGIGEVAGRQGRLRTRRSARSGSGESRQSRACARRHARPGLRRRTSNLCACGR